MADNSPGGYPVKRGYLSVFFILLLVSIPSSLAFAQNINLFIEFNPENLILSRIAGYDLVEIKKDKTFLHAEPGHPFLPVCDVHILIPANTKAVSVQSSAVEQIQLQGLYNIYPAQRPHPLSDPGPHTFTAPSREIYNLNKKLHTKTSELLGTHIIRGYHIAVVRIYPISYIPAQGKLLLHTAVNLILQVEDTSQLTPDKTAIRYKHHTPVFENLVKSEVINPQALTTDYQTQIYTDYEPSSNGDSEQQLLGNPIDPNDVKYLLIGDSSMFSQFEPLLDWKTKKGVPAEAVDVSWIYSNYTGTDNQEKIKACIADYVQNKGTVWVLLAGDETIIPDRDCYGNVNNGETTDTSIPTDLYYAGMDDMDWNDDDDNKTAEVTDDTIDMGPDVYVGRLPIRTASQATAIVDKILQYETNLLPTDFAENMILSGVELFDPGDAEGKSEYMYSSWIDPYWFPVRYRFYDTDTDFTGGDSYDVTYTHINDQLNIGYNFFHMATHGTYTYLSTETGSAYSSSLVANASNLNKYTNILTIACKVNGFENAEPCLSEAFIREPNKGAVSFIASSRYGWGYTGLTTHGSSFKYDRMFYKFLFTNDPADHPQQLGAVYTRMKEYWISDCYSYGSMRWLQFAINLMGDPEMCLYTTDPSTISPFYPANILTEPQTFTVETGISNASVCLSKGDEVYIYGVTNPSGRFSSSIEPLSGGILNVTITAPNYYPHQGQTVVVGPGDFEPDGDVDFADLAFFASWWLQTSCDIGNDYCQGTDFEPDGDVDFTDFATLVSYWGI
ncbi:MAG: C25 family cysteine peptidase [Planctomycetota bacterium]